MKSETLSDPQDLSRTRARQDSLPDFIIAGPRHELCVSGIGLELTPGPLNTLAARARAFFAELSAGNGSAPALLAGAIPFDRKAADYLFQPRARHASTPAATVQPPLATSGRIVAEPSAADYRAAVTQAIAQISAGALDKIVLSRSLRILADRPHDCAALLSNLRRDPEATAFAVSLSRTQAAPRRLLGATPELLIQRRGRDILSHPLAGSAPRRADGAADRASGAALLASDKDRREHAMAAEMVLDTLAPWCDRLEAPEGMTLSSTAQLWHLGTRIVGRLRDPDTCCATMLAALHPTPAICGTPRDVAEAALPALEGFDRGFYAGAVGWLEPSGDGCWYIALRCAEVSDREARLYAGAGIVAGSDPAEEEAETSAKFLAMLAALGLDESGAPLQTAQYLQNP